MSKEGEYFNRGKGKDDVGAEPLLTVKGGSVSSGSQKWKPPCVSTKSREGSLENLVSLIVLRWLT